MRWVDLERRQFMMTRGRPRNSAVVGRGRGSTASRGQASGSNSLSSNVAVDGGTNSSLDGIRSSSSIDNSNCGMCNDIVGQDSIGCDMCPKWFHPTTLYTGLKPEVIDFIISDDNNGIFFKCSACRCAHASQSQPQPGTRSFNVQNDESDNNDQLFEMVKSLTVTVADLVRQVAIFCCDYGNSDSLIEFQSILADLSDTICSEVYDDIIIVGDFNADPFKGRFYPRLKSMLDDLNLKTNDVISLPATSYTYISPNSVSGTSWLDHVVVSRGDLTVNHKILYGMVFYDHLPLYFEMNLPIPVCFAEGLHFSRSPQLNISWDKVSESMKKDYCLSLDKLSLAIWDDVLICNKSLCKNNAHKKSLNFLFETILEIISISSENFPVYHNNKSRRVVGWNLHCRNLYKTARLDFLSWHENGRPRIGVRFEKMKLSRSDFRNALNYCRKNESKIRKEILLAKFNHNNKSDFWKELRKLNGFNRNNLSCIDGTSDPKIIAEIFDTKYSETLKDPACQSTSDSNPQNLISEGIETCSVPLITLSDINYAIDKINVGLGWDKIHANHLKFSGQIFRNLLCKIYNEFLSHEYLPQEF